MTWLILDDVGRTVAEARSLLGGGSSGEVMAWEGAQAARENKVMRVAGSTAQIDISGVLTKRPDFWSMFFGGGNTTYGDIQSSLASAAADASIKDVVLNIDSPGGEVDGLFETLNAIQAFRDGGKKITVRASLAASAAYAIAAMAGPIEAVSPASTFGSVGVVVDYIKDSRVGSITNTDSPKKRPNYDTEEGRAVVREHLDALHALSVESIASGRGLTVEQVSEGFGQGAVFLAAEAKRRKMIDRAPGAVLRAVPATRAETHQQKDKMMDLNELKAQHPGVYSAAVQAGVAQERERVCAHLRLGEASGALKVAMTAIKDGSELSVALQAEYMAAGLDRRDNANRQADDAAASSALASAAHQQEKQMDMQDRIAARLHGGAP